MSSQIRLTFAVASCALALVSGCAAEPTQSDAQNVIDQGNVDNCAYGSEIFGDTTEDLDKFVSWTFDATIDNIDDLPEMHARQIFLTAQEFGGVKDDDDFDNVYDVVDEGTWHINVLVIDGQLYEWIQGYSGDTEIGLMFRQGTEDKVGEVDDSDIRGCN